MLFVCRKPVYERFSMKKGFTLIELLVVVLIIGILSAVALPQYQKAVEKSRTTEALSNMSTMRNQMDIYILANGFPGAGVTISYTDLADVDIQGGSWVDQGGWLDLKTKNFIYHSGCDHESCYIEVQRKQANSTIYGLISKRESNKTVWENKCYDFGEDIGKGVCKSLVSNGWSYTENSEW